jgi:hypothetical protein
MENKDDIEEQESNSKEALTPEELIKKHLSNPKHIITDEEMKNLKVGNDAEEEKELEKEIDNKEAEEGYGHRHENNAFDILDV